jgi:hypothetical protein
MSSRASTSSNEARRVPGLFPKMRCNSGADYSSDRTVSLNGRLWQAKCAIGDNRPQHDQFYLVANG